MTIIDSVDVELLVQRQEDPSWTFAGGSYPTIDGCIVTVRTRDGVIGLGYAETATHMGYSNDGNQAAIELLKPRLVGRDVAEVETLLAELDGTLVGNLPAKSGLDMALHDALAKTRGIPLHHLFGGKRRERLPQTRILPLKSPAETAAKAKEFAAAGYRWLKVKLDGEAEGDLARVQAVREAVGNDVRLTVDANQAYTTKLAIKTFNRMDAYKVELVEQPVHANNVEGLALVSKSIPMAVEADESAISVQAILHLVAHRIVDVVSLKIGKLGGLRNTLLAARICETGGVACRLGATFGPRLYCAHAAHLASSLAPVDLPSELSEFEHILDDPYEGLEVKDGAITIFNTPGCGVRRK